MNVVGYDADLVDSLSLTSVLDLPSWVSLVTDSPKSWKLKGTPTSTGEFPIKLELSDSTTSVYQEFTLEVVSHVDELKILQPHQLSHTIEEDSELLIGQLSVNVNQDRKIQWNVSKPNNGKIYFDETSNGTLSNFKYVPDENFYGSDNFAVSVEDGYTSDSRDFNVTISSIPEAPVLTDLPLSILNNDQEYYDLVIKITDGDGVENLKFSLNGLPDWLQLQSFTNPSNLEMRIFGQAPITAIGTHNITLHAWSTDDDYTTEGSFIIEVKYLNRPPVPSLDSVFAEVNEDKVKKLQNMTATDPETPSEELSWSIVSAPENGIANIDFRGTNFSYTPDNNFSGIDQFYVGVADKGFEGAASLTVKIPVVVNVKANNDLPVFTSQPTTDKYPLISWTDSTQYVYEVEVFDSDWKWQGNPQIQLNSPIPSWANWEITGGGTARISGQPSVSDEGNYTFSISATSGNDIVYQNFVLEIRVDDYPPQITKDDGTKVSEIHLLLIEDNANEETWINSLGISASNPDPEEDDFDSLVWSIHERPTSGAFFK